MRTVIAWRSLTKDAFEADDDKLTKYIEWLRDAMKEYAATIRRTVLQLLILIALFELLHASVSTELTLGPLKLSQASPILAFIPALISYLYLQAMIDSQRYTDTHLAYRGAFAKWPETAYESGLDSRVLPVEPVYWSITIGVPGKNSRTGDWIEASLSVLALFVLLLGVLVYQFRAYILLFHMESQTSALVTTSLAITLLTTAGAVAHFFSTNNE